MRMEFKNNKNGKRNYSANSIDLFLTRLFFGVKNGRWRRSIVGGMTGSRATYHIVKIIYYMCNILAYEVRRHDLSIFIPFVMYSLFSMAQLVAPTLHF